MSLSKVEVLLQVTKDLSENPNNYSDDIIDKLKEFSKNLVTMDVSGSLAKSMYDDIIYPSEIIISDYWNNTYISKPIYKSLKKFYNNDIDNVELLIMITSILNRSLIAVRDEGVDIKSIRIPDLSDILLQLSQYNLEDDYPEELLIQLKVVCNSLELFNTFE